MKNKAFQIALGLTDDEMDNFYNTVVVTMTKVFKDNEKKFKMEDLKAESNTILGKNMNKYVNIKWKFDGKEAYVDKFKVMTEAEFIDFGGYPNNI